jgi:hypothetical protein
MIFLIAITHYKYEHSLAYITHYKYEKNLAYTKPLNCPTLVRFESNTISPPCIGFKILKERHTQA